MTGLFGDAARGGRSSRAGRLRRLLAPGALALLALPVGLGAQEPWRASYFPYPMGSPTDGAMLIFRYQYTKNAPFFIDRGDQEILNPITFAGALSAEAGIGTSGSRFARVEFRAPGLIDGWRLRGFLTAERRGRFAFYGTGGDLEAAARAPDPNANAFRVHRSRYQVLAEVSRRIQGPLYAALALSLEHTVFSPLDEGRALFTDRFGAEPVSSTDFRLRPALVLDTRDLEFTPGWGTLAEVAIGVGTARRQNLTDPAPPTDDKAFYAFGFAHVRQYLSLREGTVVAGRLLFRDLGDAAPLSARFGVSGWERDFALSGPHGHRSFPVGAFAGTRVTLASLEVRHDLLNAGDFGAVTLLAFADWGRIADNTGSPRRTSMLGGGGGLALRVLRSAILTFNFAGGPNGFNFSMGNGWAF